MSWDTFYKITNILQDESWHFGLSAISGLLAFLLILTMFGAAWWMVNTMSRSDVYPTLAARRGMVGLALSCGLLSAWLLHIGLDWLVRLYHTPLGPHLPLITR